ncbi:MAG TPA: YqaA family protein [Noviherbaspirillum sp.]|nr:YqaA family protein [Noviherbaspirillum sp.]
MIESAILWLLNLLAVPEVGLTSVFIVSLLSATLLPMGSEPAVFAVIKVNGAMFWPVIAVATVGNTIGGAIDYWMGYGAKQAFASGANPRWLGWFERFGPKTMLLAWLPGIGDPLCTLGGWLKMPFWPCVTYMAIGKFLRYVTMTTVLLYIPDGVWQFIGSLLI